jgi:hypothetical protein
MNKIINKEGLKGNVVPLIVGVIIVVCVIYSISLMPPSITNNATNNQMCNKKGCPFTNSSDLYKLHTDYGHQRRKNDMLNKHNIIHCKGPANIFIIRHGEKLKTKFHLDCNGILRSAYIPELIEQINEKGFGVSALLTALPHVSMHKEQTVALTSWLINIPLFMYGNVHQPKDMIKELFTNPFYNGKTVLICWEHQCMQSLLKVIIDIGPKTRGIKNYVFKNPEGTSELPYWHSNNYNSIFYLDKDLNFSVLKETVTTCYPKDNNIILYGKKQSC